MANYPQLDNASGVWNLREVYDAVMGGYWPNANSTGLFFGGFNPAELKEIAKVNISTTGNATVFGDLSTNTGNGGAVGSFTRAIFGAGVTPAASPAAVDKIEYVQFATEGNAASFGDLTSGGERTNAASNSTRGLWFGGFDNPSYLNVINYITMNSLGNSSDFGDLTSSRRSLAASASPTRAIMAGGDTGSLVNTIDFVEIDTTGNATDFGDLTSTNQNAGGAASSTRYVCVGGNNPSSITTLQFVTIASQGNAIDYGDLSLDRQTDCATNSVKSVNYAGYNNPAAEVNTIDIFTISTGGTATDFGDAVTDNFRCRGASNSHGGLNDGYQGTRPLPFNEAGGDLGLYFGGEGASTSNRICEINISSTGNASDFSGVDVVAYDVSGAGNKTRGINYSGTGPGGSEQSARYVEFKTRGNFADFGEATASRQIVGCAANNTRLLAGGGSTPSNVNTIDYITIGTLGNAADFGDLTAARKPLAASSSNTRAVWAGGNNPDPTNVMDYVTISTTGNAADFGDLSVARRNGASANSTTRIVFAGGRSNPSPATESNVIDYITTATTGNATDFGDLTSARIGVRGVSNTTRGCFMSGLETPGGNVNIIDFVTIGSTGNASDFGDLIAAVRGGGSASNGHGGLVGG